MTDYKKIIQDLDKTKKFDMGPRWKPEELDIFLKYYRESEFEKLDEMQQLLSQSGYERSKINLISVYLKNKNFLTFNKQVTGDMLAMIMADHYDNLEIQQQQLMNQKEEAKKKQKQQLLQLQQNNAAPSLSSQIEAPNTQQNAINQVNQPSSNEDINSKKAAAINPPQSNRKKQKIQKGLNEQSENMNNGPMQQMIQLINQGHNYQFTSQAQQVLGLNNGNNVSNSNITSFQQINKRKSKMPKGRFLFDLPNDFEKRIAYIEEISKNCNGKNPKKQTKKLSSLEQINESSLQWIEHEFFYSTIDKPFFQFNEFKEMLAKVGLENIGKLTKAEWNIIRKAMGKPRRFSNEFVRGELKKLEIYRKIVREYLQTQQVHALRSKIRESLSEEIMKIQPFRVGQVVMGIHPNCKHFHPGSVLTTNGDMVIVKFLTNDLGVLKIPDTKLSIDYTANIQGNSDEFASQKGRVILDGQVDEGHYNKGQNALSNNASYQNQNEQKHSSQQTILQDLDYFSMAFLIKLLDRKTLLINELKEFNELAIRKKNEPLDETFYQKYGWTGIQINLIDNALKHVIAKFRLRGLNHYSQQQIAENLNKILQVPLSYIERELEENSVDHGILNEIRNISNKNADEKIQQSVNSMITKGEQKLMKERGEVYRKQLEENYYSNGYGNLLNIVYNCLGILQTLKCTGDININQNQFLNSLAQSIYTENSEQFLEINDVIQDILQKYKDSKRENHSLLNNSNNIQEHILSSTQKQPLSKNNINNNNSNNNNNNVNNHQELNSNLNSNPPL
ncbi:hypothetical protein ABPG72_004025 [Tetrahymena utriculariae]